LNFLVVVAARRLNMPRRFDLVHPRVGHAGLGQRRRFVQSQLLHGCPPWQEQLGVLGI
jgi:hypothetical protein